MTKTITTIFLCVLFSITSGTAQDNPYSLKNNLYTTYGSQFGVGNVDLGTTEYSFYDFGFSLGARYNLYDFTDNIAVGFEVAPEIGMMRSTEFNEEGFLGLMLPAFVSLNFGAGSTYDSDKNIGIAIKSGMQLIAGPLIIDTARDLNKTNWMPVVQLSGRFYQKLKKRLAEVYLKYGRTSENTSFIDGNAILYVGGCYFIGY